MDDYIQIEDSSIDQNSLAEKGKEKGNSVILNYIFRQSYKF